MTLATHAITGGAVASLFPSHPIIAFFAGFFSHYILDAIPHWDYKLHSMHVNSKLNKRFVLDLLRASVDALLGIFVVLLIWHSIVLAQWKVLSLGVIGGLLPDFLQFVYTRFPHQPMVFIQRFHDLMHAEYEVDNKKPFIGVSLQVTLVACVILLAKYLARF